MTIDLSPTKDPVDLELYDAAIALLAAARPGQEAEAAQIVAELKRDLDDPLTTDDARRRVRAVVSHARSLGMTLPSASRVLH